MHNNIRAGIKYACIGIFGLYALKTFKDIIVNGGKLVTVDEDGDVIGSDDAPPIPESVQEIEYKEG